MFTKETYIRRRAELKKLVGEGVIVLFGNNDAPCNYPANCYAPMRQDSSFLYYVYINSCLIISSCREDLALLCSKIL